MTAPLQHPALLIPHIKEIAMTDAEARTTALARDIYAVVRRACPDGSLADAAPAFDAVMHVMVALLYAMGPGQMPFIEDVCSDLGAEILRQVQEAHAEDTPPDCALH